MRKARKKPFLTPPQIQKRLEWSHASFHTDWRSIAFTDQAALESGVRKGASFTIRRVGEEFQEKHLVPTFKQKRKSFIVWRAVALGRKWPLMRLEHDAFYDGKNEKNGINRYGYINSVLEPHLAAYLSEIRREGRQGVMAVEDGAKMQDNALAQQAREELHINLNCHPPNSPNLNAIEQLWGHVKHRLGKLMPVPLTEDKLWEAVAKVWDDLEQDLVERRFGTRETGCSLSSLSRKAYRPLSSQELQGI